MADTPFNASIINHMPSLAEVSIGHCLLQRGSKSQHAKNRRRADSWQEYRPFPWLTNGHVETIWAALFRRGANVKYYRRCLSMSDGGVVSIDYEYPQKVLD